MVDLVYELVPGVEAAEAPTDRSQPFTVDATYGADVPLLWSTGGTGPDGSGGTGWIEKYQGGASTLGGLGPWPVPDGAQHLTFWLHAATGDYKCRGALRVDLSNHAVRWDPIETIQTETLRPGWTVGCARTRGQVRLIASSSTWAARPGP